MACAGIIKAATTIGTNISTGGTLNVSGASTLTGNTNIVGSLTSSGANTFYGATSIGGALTATSTFAVNGATTLYGALTGYGNTTLSNLTATGTLSVTGLATLGNASSTLLSVSGNSYFNGDLIFTPITPPGTGAWSVGTAVSGGSINNCTTPASQHSYQVTFADANGNETAIDYGGFKTGTVTAVNKTITITLPTTTESRVAYWKIYRSVCYENGSGLAKYFTTDLYDLQYNSSSLIPYSATFQSDGSCTAPCYVDTSADATIKLNGQSFSYIDETGGSIFWKSGEYAFGYSDTSTLIGNDISTSIKGYSVLIVGSSVGYNGMTGDGNVFVGNNMALNCSTCRDNVAVGPGAFTSPGGLGITAGNGASDTVAIGSSAMGADLTNDADRNTAVGAYVMNSNTAGADNAAYGQRALQQNSTGNQNTGIGSWVGYSSTTASDNTFLGYKSGYSNTTGATNIYIGSQAGYANTTGSNNIFIGYKTAFSLPTTHSNSILIGPNVAIDADNILAVNNAACTSGGNGTCLLSGDMTDYTVGGTGEYLAVNATLAVKGTDVITITDDGAGATYYTLGSAAVTGTQYHDIRQRSLFVFSCSDADGCIINWGDQSNGVAGSIIILTRNATTANNITVKEDTATPYADLQGVGDFTMMEWDTITLIRLGTRWVEQSRSVN